ncbi:hypothetical protein J4727_10780 [Providencia rettgeri]|uniref:Uncharacterized protein n=1 Tax=Providencia rettgeri TaxID=587 RepID=A0A939SRD2_PRORE|nr:hypothetical protein [Providencia rettgeri]
MKPKLPNSLLLSTAIWSTAILPMVPSYAQIVHLDDLPTLGGQAIQFEGTNLKIVLNVFSGIWTKCRKLCF